MHLLASIKSMPGSNASSDGFDRSPLHAEGGGGGEDEEETAHDDGPEQTGADEKLDDVAAGDGNAALPASKGGAKEEPNLGPTPQPSSSTAGKIFIGGLTVDTSEKDLKACFEVPVQCSAHTHAYLMRSSYARQARCKAKEHARA